MEIRAPLLLSGCLIAGMTAMSLWATSWLPEHGLIATHFDLSGHPNGYMSRPFALWLMPAIASIMTAAMVAMAKHPAKDADAIAQSSSGYIIGWLGGLMVLFVGHCAIIFYARGVKFDVAGSGALIAAFLFVALGNALGKTRPNPWVGVRTPWTKKSDLAWDKTNRLAGRLMVAGGLATLAALALGGPLIAHAVLITSALGLVAVCIPLSRHYWKNDPNRRS